MFHCITEIISAKQMFCKCTNLIYCVCKIESVTIENLKLKFIQIMSFCAFGIMYSHNKEKKYLLILMFECGVFNHTFKVSHFGGDKGRVSGMAKHF
jgi:hypothetical protein